MFTCGLLLEVTPRWICLLYIIMIRLHSQRYVKEHVPQRYSQAFILILLFFPVSLIKCPYFVTPFLFFRSASLKTVR
jgi:hypothetical protein